MRNADVAASHSWVEGEMTLSLRREEGEDSAWVWRMKEGDGTLNQSPQRAAL